MTHLAGDLICVGPWYVQRCCLCGAAILEGNAAYEMSPDGHGVAAFALGAFVEVEGTQPVRSSVVGQAEGPRFASDLELPDNCCIRKEQK